MQFSYDKQNDSIKYVCPNCNQMVVVDCSDFASGQSPNQFGELEFENFIVDCECGATTLFNLQIPECDYSELDLEEEVFTYEQINLRNQVRDFMWAKRSDLKQLDRNKFNDEQIPNLPGHIQTLIKRNNMIQTLLGNLNVKSMLNVEQTEVIKNAALQIVSGQVSLLKVIEVLAEYFATCEQ